MNVAVIPARNGSKRLPGKNLRDFCGLGSLVSIATRNAIESGCFEHVIISTDNENIANDALFYGAIWQAKRPERLSNDEAKTGDVIEYEIQKLERKIGISVNSICILQPTSPLRKINDIKKSYELFSNKKLDSVVSISSEFEDKPTTMEFFENGKYKSSRVNGAIYWMKRKLLPNLELLYCKNSAPFFMDINRSVDIDTLADFKIAEQVYKSYDR